MLRHWTHQETPTTFLETTNPITGQTATIAKVSAKTRRCRILIKRVVGHLLIHKDSKAHLTINGHIRETDVHRNHAPSCKSLFQVLRIKVEGRTMQRLKRKMTNSKPLTKLKTERLKGQIQLLLQLRTSQLVLQPSIMLLQSSHSPRKVELPLTIHTKSTKMRT